MKASPLVLLVIATGCPKESAPPPPPEPPKPIERTDVIKRGDTPLTLVGRTLEVGDRLPDVTLSGPDLKPIRLADYKGKVLVLSVVPSIDTPVCEAQTHHVSDAMERMGPNTAVITVSRDLPFAQQRFKQEAMTKTDFGSDYHGGEFGRAFGLEVKETGLLARSVWVVRPDGTIRYRELVADQTTEPDVDALLAAVLATSGR